MVKQINLEETKSIRGAYGKALVEEGKNNPDIVVLDADLSCSTQTAQFAKEFPERFFNVGIAEQDLITTAAGLSTTGKIPFLSAFAVFATGRAYDQVRNTVCYSNFNVKIVGTHGGITVGEDGATHQALEDISLMRGLPNMTVIVPSDCNECQQVINFAANYEGPVYIRVPRENVPDVYDENYKFDIKKAVILKEGTDVTLITNGDLTAQVLKCAELLEKNGVNAQVVNVPVVKPIDYETILNCIKKTNRAITIENHSVIGGLGSAVCEITAEKYPIKVSRIGINDCFGQSGTTEGLLDFYGLTYNKLADKILELLK